MAETTNTIPVDTGEDCLFETNLNCGIVLLQYLPIGD